MKFSQFFKSTLVEEGKSNKVTAADWAGKSSKADTEDVLQLINDILKKKQVPLIGYDVATFDDPELFKLLKEYKTEFKAQTLNKDAYETLFNSLFKTGKSFKKFKTTEGKNVPITEITKDYFDANAAGKIQANTTKIVSEAYSLVACKYFCKNAKDIPQDQANIEVQKLSGELAQFAEAVVKFGQGYYDNAIKHGKALDDLKFEGDDKISGLSDIKNVWFQGEGATKDIYKSPAVKKLAGGADTWNPGDIWLTTTTGEKSLTAMADEKDIVTLNETLKSLITRGHVLPISLKKVPKKQDKSHVDFVNFDEILAPSSDILSQFKISKINTSTSSNQIASTVVIEGSKPFAVRVGTKESMDKSNTILLELKQSGTKVQLGGVNTKLLVDYLDDNESVFKCGKVTDFLYNGKSGANGLKALNDLKGDELTAAIELAKTQLSDLSNVSGFKAKSFNLDHELPSAVKWQILLIGWSWVIFVKLAEKKTVQEQVIFKMWQLAQKITGTGGPYIKFH